MRTLLATLALTLAPIALAGELDFDGDGVPDTDDNCPYRANPAQEDRGSYYSTDPDGIGDACQCGDVTGDGIAGDASFMDRRGMGFNDPLFREPGNCDVSGDNLCDSADADIVRAGPIPQTCPNAIPDYDRDSFENPDDNCPFLSNPEQADGGGINTTDPDGIGDACQCGDVTGNGIVNGQDGFFITRYGLGYDDPLFLEPGNCDVTGNEECNGQDGVFTTRAGLGIQDPPDVFGQNCPNADPFVFCDYC